MRGKLWIAMALLALMGGPRGWTQESRLNRLMVDKLKNAQKLLEGIAIGDFTKVSGASEELIQISHKAEWFAIKTPRFEMHSNEFRRSAEVILQKSKAKNLDGVSLAYLDMVMTCVRCHQYVREVRDARLPLPNNPIGIAQATSERNR